MKLRDRVASLKWDIETLQLRSRLDSQRLAKLEDRMKVALCNHDPVPAAYGSMWEPTSYHMTCSKCGGHLRDLTYREYLEAHLDKALGDSSRWQEKLNVLDAEEAT